MNNKIKENELRIKMLPPEFYIKEFNGDDDCNYEKYLLEFLNVSNYFQKKSGGERYYKPESEDNGQCDAISKRYCIDFKLMESSSLMEGKSVYSSQRKEILPGVIVSQPSKASGGTIGVNLYNEIRKLSHVEDIQTFKKVKSIKKELRNLENVDKQVEYEIFNLREKLEIEKNLLFLLPREFNTEKDYALRDMIEEIEKIIGSDFSILYAYREYINLSNFDVFISCFCNGYIMFFKLKSKEAEFVESIRVNESRTYSSLYKKYYLK